MAFIHFGIKIRERERERCVSNGALKPCNLSHDDDLKGKGLGKIKQKSKGGWWWGHGECIE